MEESINPIISIGPVIFNLTMLAMTLLIVGVIFVFIYWASRNMTLKPKGKQMYLSMSMTLLLDLQNLTLVRAT